MLARSQGIRTTPLLDRLVTTLIHTRASRQVAALLHGTAACVVVAWQTTTGDTIDTTAVQPSRHALRGRG